MPMTEETQSVDTKLSIYKILGSDSLIDELEDEYLEDLGSKVVKGFDLDKTSRVDWEQRTEESMKLALQVVEAKSFPWPNASNVKFPLITIAALQFHARAYPTLIPTSSIVKCKVNADDTEGEIAARATRVEKHMSFQLLEEDENWEDQTDKVLITQPIIGCAFKKTYFDPIKNHNISENILAKDLVVSYFTKSFETCSRVSHVLYMTENDLYERVVRGIYRDVELSKPLKRSADNLQSAQDQAQGLVEAGEDDTKPHEIIEQHLYLDLDGDGYKEPYIVTVHRDSKQVLRLVPRFFLSNITFKGTGKDEKILSIKAEQYFTKFPFIPSPDGGFYDLGFGVLLGPLNNSINTVINQLIDSGTMSVTAGGFLSRGVKIKGGNTSFQPNEWKPVESTGDDLRKGIVPLPVREPSQVLFTLLSLLINYGERIGGSVDILVGQNPGQNTPAETSRTMAEQGMKIFSGIFKRNYRSLRDEFRKLYRLNQLYMDKEVKFGALSISPDDYLGSPGDITPAADPNMVSDSQRIMQAQALVMAAKESPALHNQYEVHKRYYEALRIQDIEKVLPNPKGPNAIPPQKPVKVQEAEVKAQAMIQGKQIQAKSLSDKLQLEIAKLMQDAETKKAEVAKLEAETLYLLEQADGVSDGHQIAMMEMQLGHAKMQQDGIMNSVKLMQSLQKQQMEEQQMKQESKQPKE
jgi:chaperonin GroES